MPLLWVLRDTLNMTDGNITTHIKTLQQAGYVGVTKSVQNNRPLTTCSLTTAGRTSRRANPESRCERAAQEAGEHRRAPPA